MAARYAIYYAPAATSRLWQLASTWLGRDARNGEPLAQPQFPTLSDIDFAAITADPRHYGFHATLKAPFVLASGRSEAELMDAASAFAAERTAFRADIAPQALGRFLAFRIKGPSSDMDTLHAECVRAFEPFRAPLSDADLARRRRANLTALQDEHLVQWGYPYVFESFRFHMTLTAGIDDDVLRERILTVAQAYFADVPVAHEFGSISLFKQVDRDSLFTIIARFEFASPQKDPRCA
jgi:putative phosphonate metabolism protein